MPAQKKEWFQIWAELLKMPLSAATLLLSAIEKSIDQVLDPERR